MPLRWSSDSHRRTQVTRTITTVNCPDKEMQLQLVTNLLIPKQQESAMNSKSTKQIGNRMVRLYILILVVRIPLS